jgi:hypothetical protein
MDGFKAARISVPKIFVYTYILNVCIT